MYIQETRSEQEIDLGDKNQARCHQEQAVVLLRSKLQGQKNVTRYSPEVKAGEPKRMQKKVLSEISNKSREGVPSNYTEVC